MKVIIAPDSFKGSLTAIEAARAMREGIREVDPAIETILLPAADGGEGTMQSLVDATGGRFVDVSVEDPLGRAVMASYGVLGDGKTCVIEIAEASGLTRLHTDELDPIVASSYGTGMLIAHAMDAGYRNFIIGLGGSATNDGGAGLLQALGIRFLNQKGEELSKGGGALQKIASIHMENWDPRIAQCEFTVACDVSNPLVGPNGASAVFGPQKGATEKDIALLDRSLQRFADLIEKETGIALHNKEGAGAAGGAGGAFQAFFNCVMRQGIDVVLEAIEFDRYLDDADLVLTGEGKTDMQTLSGKTPIGIAQAAREKGKPAILISGMIDEESRSEVAPYFTEIHAIVDGGISQEDGMEEAFVHLKERTKKVMEQVIYL